ncbi:MAG: sugar phosphate isomerase/epimerase [Chloroflexota bacterium]|nr:sugar phosphate isomerase/epimerase [Chloroflexota bacterium]
MKLSLSMYSCVRAVQAGRLDLMGFVDYAAAQGVAGVELLDMFWRDARREIPAVKARIAAAGMDVAVYSISNNFIQPNASARAQELSDLKRGVDIALELGTDIMRVFSGNAREGVSQAQGMDWILEGLSAGAAYAESQGVTLALENHGKFAGRSDQVRDIIDAVASPALRVNLDTGNFLPVGQDPTEAARRLADMVVLAHLKDMRRATGDEASHVFADPDGQLLTGCVIGAGLVDLPAIRAVMEDADYAGWWSLEYEGAEEPLSVGVPRSLAAARKILG